MDKRTKIDKDPKEQEKATDDSGRVGSASRARNRTVMLTPDLAGNIRARLMESDTADSSSSKDSGFMSPLNRGGSGAENLRDSTRMIRRDDVNLDDKSLDKTKEERGTAKFSTRDYKKEVVEEVNEDLGVDSGEQEEPVRDYQAQVFTQAPVFEARTQSVSRNSESRELEPPKKPVLKSEKKKLIGFLVDYQDDPNGEIIELRVGRWLITSRSSDQGDCILIDHHTVSPLHAILRVSDKGTIQVLDQLSEFGTGITKEGSAEEEEIAGSMANVFHGDRVRFGEKTYIVCLVPTAN